MTSMFKSVAVALLPLAAASALLIAGCKDDHAHKPGDGHPHPPAAGQSAGGAAGATQPAGKPGHAGASKVLLGTQSVGGYDVKAYQSGPIADGELDVTLIGGPGKPKAVRFWVGVASGEGSVKAKADEESPGTWHTHPEVPKPLPPGSQFWVEIEPPTGEKVKAAFDVK